jgi:hypothetical protein
VLGGVRKGFQGCGKHDATPLLSTESAAGPCAAVPSKSGSSLDISKALLCNARQRGDSKEPTGLLVNQLHTALKSGLTGKWHWEARGRSLAGGEGQGNPSCGPS